MSDFLDASVLVEACLLRSAKFREADALVSANHCTSAHALIEAYATLSGDKRLKIRPAEAAQMVGDCSERLRVGVLDAGATRELIRQAPSRGITGGLIFDTLHAETARSMGCGIIHTLNESHFRHVAPDLTIQSL